MANVIHRYEKIACLFREYLLYLHMSYAYGDSTVFYLELNH